VSVLLNDLVQEHIRDMTLDVCTMTLSAHYDAEVAYYTKRNGRTMTLNGGLIRNTERIE
jgi:hypothetical protein